MSKKRTLFCCGCQAEVSARLTDGKEIYPHRRDLHDLPFWKCDACKNFVGCHHKTANHTKPLGRMTSFAIAHTPLPWKPVQKLRFTTPGGLLYTSVEPVEAKEADAPLRMADGSYHVCRFSHTSNVQSAALHRANAEFIAKASNSYYGLVKALEDIRDAHPTGTSWSTMTDGTWREALRDLQRIARLALASHSGGPAA
ncbi:hypothetical protein [Rhizobium rhizogenes]|uniref:hypothetical protein n=1 Tax=Rhizobium rhizogenes TaxID=359 RepID=UPI001573F52E|nr:hypothetical protein [Rhizobium rhizogenes]NTG07102.1 hypothetical protein [Rhizobium rhizogenes]